jgi:hypothetical protein
MSSDAAEKEKAAKTCRRLISPGSSLDTHGMSDLLWGHEILAVLHD